MSVTLSPFKEGSTLSLFTVTVRDEKADIHFYSQDCDCPAKEKAVSVEVEVDIHQKRS